MSEVEPDLDDIVAILEEDGASDPARPPAARPWRVLVVDDDSDVHATTTFALGEISLLGRPVELLHASSAAEGREMALAHKDIAVALIDVVMETNEAGLWLVRELRLLGFREMRLVLRTGQPGYAPERRVIAEYEIDDYRTKAELTQERLLTILTASLRAYDHIRTINRSRDGLEMIVRSATKLFQRTNLELFSRGVLTQIAALLGATGNGFVCLHGQPGKDSADRIVSAIGRFAEQIGAPASALADPGLQMLLQQARDDLGPSLAGGCLTLHFCCEAGRELTVVMEADVEIDQPDMDLLMLFSTNIAVGFENLSLVDELDRLAYLDPVLRLPNLNAFGEALSRRLEAGPGAARMALISVDAFQSLSAVHGLDAAHGLLVEIHDALVAAAGAALTVARIGDGTLALLADREVLNEPLIRNAVKAPFRINDLQIAATATSAILELGDVGKDLATIFRTATGAMLQAKRTQRGKCVIYDATMRAQVDRTARLETGLRQSLEIGDGFAVHLQPKFDLESRVVTGAEALLRWNLAGEAVGPSEFIPIAESAGLIGSLTDRVVHALGHWARERGSDNVIPVAVNLSLVNLNRPGYADWLLRQVAEAGLSPDSIEFEVTEGLAHQNMTWSVEQAQHLQAAGFRIALDDFGTGYSSLSQFNRLPFHTLKIDRSFVADLHVYTARASLAAVILTMTTALDVTCVAEGIETEEQLQALRFLGCRYGQGYLLGRPVPMERFAATFLAE